jgi:hypothetical protein
MIEEAVKYLMKSRLHQHVVYLHNFSYFDSVFLINILSKLSDKIAPVIRDGKFINFKFYFKKHYYLVFRDSLLLLPLSLQKLQKLGLAFGDFMKGVFPYKFVDNIHVKLDYEGKFPRIKFFDMKKFK